MALESRGLGDEDLFASFAREVASIICFSPLLSTPELIHLSQQFLFFDFQVA